jgi:hypothetical protein
MSAVASILDAKEVNRAQIGPRAQKDPRSKDYAIQTLHSLKLALNSLEYDRNLVRREVGEVREYEHWRILGYPSVETYFDAELADLPPIARTNATALGLIATATRQAIERPAKGRKKNGSNTTNFSNTERHSKSGILRRLARKHPEILARVETGELSANAAAIAAGFRTKTITMQITVSGAVSALRKHFTDEQQRAISEALAAPSAGTSMAM